MTTSDDGEEERSMGRRLWMRPAPELLGRGLSSACHGCGVVPLPLTTSAGHLRGLVYATWGAGPRRETYNSPRFCHRQSQPPAQSSQPTPMPPAQSASSVSSSQTPSPAASSPWCAGTQSAHAHPAHRPCSGGKTGTSGRPGGRAPPRRLTVGSCCRCWYGCCLREARWSGSR